MCEMLEVPRLNTCRCLRCYDKGAVLNYWKNIKEKS